VKPIADQLRRIADAEGIQADDAALMLIARAGDGSMRDAQSAFDQVIAFAGTAITPDDVSSVLGLVRRDLLIEIADAIAADNAPILFDLSARAVEAGYDLRLVVRELARLTRDLLVLSIDPSRVSDPEIAAESERRALLDLSRRFSGEDLMRAFDVLTKAEYDIKGSMQPRYHLEMALLRWVHLRRLTPLAALIKQMEPGARAAGGPAPPRPAPPPAVPPRTAPPAPMAKTAPKPAGPTEGRKPAGEGGPLKEAFLEEIRKQKKYFYGTVVAQAQRIDLQPDAVSFVFAPQHRARRAQFEQMRSWLEETAGRLAGRKMSVSSADGVAVAAGGPPPTGDSVSRAAGFVETTAAKGAAVGPDRKQELKERALADNGVQAMLDVFAAEIKDIEEM